MATPQTIDVDALLAPIPGDNPAGEPVRYAGPYDAIQEARRADDDLDQGEWKRETKSADWLGVIAIATETLAAKSKDLQIAVWLTEALVKRHGFPGLRDGLRLLRVADFDNAALGPERDSLFRHALLEIEHQVVEVDGAIEVRVRAHLDVARAIDAEVGIAPAVDLVVDGAARRRPPSAVLLGPLGQD